MPYSVPINQKIFDNHELLTFYVRDQHATAQITYLSTIPATSTSMNNYCCINAWNDPSVSESRSLLNTDGKKNLELEHLLTPLWGSYQKTLQIRNIKPSEQKWYPLSHIKTIQIWWLLWWVTSGTCFTTTVKNSLCFSYRNWKPEKASNVL